MDTACSQCRWKIYHSLTKYIFPENMKQKVGKQQRLPLGRKYLTTREQKLRKQVAKLLGRMRDLDAEVEKIRQLERSALEAWEGRGAAEPALEGVLMGEAENKVRTPSNLRPEPGTPRTPRAGVNTSYNSFNQSDNPASYARAPSTNQNRTLQNVVNGDVKQVENGAEEVEEMEVIQMGMFPSPGDSPLPQLWSHKTASDTEMQSDMSDYEARTRQLSDMLRWRQKEGDKLKERLRRMKGKLKALKKLLKRQLEMPEPKQMKEADGNSQHRQWVPHLQALSTRQLQMMVDSFSALESSVAQTADRPSSAPDSRDQLIQRCLQYTEPCRLVPVLIKLLSSRQSGEAPETTTTPLREYDPVNTSRSLSLERSPNERSTGEQLPEVYTTQDHDELRSNISEIQACQPDWNGPQNPSGVLPPLGLEDITTMLNWSLNQNEDSSSTSSSAFDDKTTIHGSRRENGRDENKLTTILDGRLLLYKRFCSPLPLNVGTAVGFDSDSKTNDSRSLPDRSESSREFNDMESSSSEEHNCMPIFQ